MLITTPWSCYSHFTDEKTAMHWFSDSPKISQLVEVNLRYKPGSLHQNLFSSPYVIMLLKLWRAQKAEEKMAPGSFVLLPREPGTRKAKAAVLPSLQGAGRLKEPPS